VHRSPGCREIVQELEVKFVRPSGIVSGLSAELWIRQQVLKGISDIAHLFQEGYFTIDAWLRNERDDNAYV
jgi:hypothetical protein